MTAGVCDEIVVPGGAGHRHFTVVFDAAGEDDKVSSGGSTITVGVYYTRRRGVGHHGEAVARGVLRAGTVKVGFGSHCLFITHAPGLGLLVKQTDYGPSVIQVHRSACGGRVIATLPAADAALRVTPEASASRGCAWDPSEEEECAYRRAVRELGEVHRQVQDIQRHLLRVKLDAKRQAVDHAAGLIGSLKWEGVEMVTTSEAVHLHTRDSQHQDLRVVVRTDSSFPDEPDKPWCVMEQVGGVERSWSACSLREAVGLAHQLLFFHQAR